MEQTPSPVLRTAIGNYGHTTALKDGTIISPMFDLEHVEVSPVPMIFRRMVRGRGLAIPRRCAATSEAMQRPEPPTELAARDIRSSGCPIMSLDARNCTG